MMTGRIFLEASSLDGRSDFFSPSWPSSSVVGRLLLVVGEALLGGGLVVWRLVVFFGARL
jgi:hypothetical protein